LQFIYNYVADIVCTLPVYVQHGREYKFSRPFIALNKRQLLQKFAENANEVLAVGIITHKKQQRVFEQ